MDVSDVVKLVTTTEEMTKEEFDAMKAEAHRIFGDFSVEEVGHVAITCVGVIHERNEGAAHALLHVLKGMMGE